MIVVVAVVCKGESPTPAIVAMLPTGYIAQWLERLTADQQVPGSNPGVPSTVGLLQYVAAGGGGGDAWGWGSAATTRAATTDGPPP